MNIIKKWLAALCLGLVTASAMASSSLPQSGVEYLTLEKPQATDTGKKIEVIEFFGYFCSYCYGFETPLNNWVRKQGGNIVYKRVAVGFGEATIPQQKMFYALTLMGRLEDVHAKIFHAVQVERIPLRSDGQVMDFITRHGIDKKQFSDLYHSFTVQSLLNGASALQSAFKINGVPMVAIDGRFVTSMSMVAKGIGQNMTVQELQVATFRVMDALVAKARQDRGVRKDKTVHKSSGLKRL